MTDQAKKRPEFRNINVFSDLPTYRLPWAGKVSILHRISGMLMFILLPFVFWMFDTSLSSEISFATFKGAFNEGLGFVPGWLIKLATLGLIWGYLHHLLRRHSPHFGGYEPRAHHQTVGCLLGHRRAGGQPGPDHCAGRQAVWPVLISPHSPVLQRKKLCLP